MSVRELELCGRLAYAAAANQDSLVRTAVVKVLFNRARGGSIENELYKQNQFYEVESPMFNVSLKDEVFRECLKAAEAAPKSKVIPDDFIYFMNIGCKSERMKRILSQNPKAIYLGDLVFF